MEPKFSLDLKDFEAALVALQTTAPQAVAQALDRAATSAVAEIATGVAADTGLPSRQAKEQLTVVKTPSSRTILAPTRRLPLIRFGARGPEPSRGKGAGVSYKLPVKGRGRAPHAFIATAKGARRAVFERVGRERDKLRELHGPSIWQAALQRAAEAGARALETLRTRLQHEISRRSGK